MNCHLRIWRWLIWPFLTRRNWEHNNREWMSGWINEWMDGRMNEWINEWSLSPPPSLHPSLSSPSPSSFFCNCKRATLEHLRRLLMCVQQTKWDKTVLLYMCSWVCLHVYYKIIWTLQFLSNTRLNFHFVLKNAVTRILSKKMFNVHIYGKITGSLDQWGNRFNITWPESLLHKQWHGDQISCGDLFLSDLNINATT